MEAHTPGSVGSLSAVVGLGKALRALLHAVNHHLPAVLLLSVAAAALLTARPDALRALDADLMALTDRAGRSLGQRLPGARGMEDLGKIFDEQGGKWGNAVTMLALAPAAHKEWLNGASPLPRAEMACFLRQLAGWVARAKLERQPTGQPAANWRPVIALDFDVTPVEFGGDPVAWNKDSPAGKCMLQSSEDKPAPATCNKLKNSDDAMRCALSRLSDEALVLAIVYPRTTPAGQSRRNAFISSTCACSAQDCPTVPEQTALRDGRMIYASPHLGVTAGEQVFEFPYQLKPALTGLPIRFPGLGPVLAEAVLATAPVDGRPAAEPAELTSGKPLLNQFCKAVHQSAGTALFDDLLAADNGKGQMLPRYDYRNIAMGQVRSRITEAELFPTRARPSNPSAEPYWLRDTIRASLSGVEASDDVYVVTVDNGTTDDRFAVPAFEHSVMGAWVHGAIALTLLAPEEERANRQPSVNASAEPARYFGKKFVHELLVGLWVVVLAWLMHHVLQARWRKVKGHYPLLRHLMFSAVPFVAVVLMATWELLSIHAKYVDGTWDNPLPLLIAMLVHLHLDSLSQAREFALTEQRARHGLSTVQDLAHPVSRGDRVARRVLQWLWSSLILVALLYWSTGVLGFFPGWFVVLAMGAIFGGAFVYLATREGMSALPLAWRESHGHH